MFFDSHAHYDDKKFKKDLDAIMKKIKEAGVDYVVNVGADVDTSLKSLELADQYDFIYASVGVHPHDVKDLMEEDIEKLYGMAATHDKVVAFGEIGLDYHYDYSPRELQKEWFVEQIELAKELELPIIVHSREASQDTYNILKDYKGNMFGGVIHCFSGSAELAKEYVKDDYYIGIGGVITFPNAKKTIEVVKEIPLDYLLIETDCPYLAPVPHRGQRNDSSNLKFIAEKIAELKGVSLEEVAEKTMANAKKLYGIQ
ncbi:TatD family hydrolase [Vallitalea okinawensis]|uniref:TatD family hydrolase n=1 Tax=Vallitalea okinawensis TaxID=2078660 RepID=UPI000CFBF94F|nr:TatD family hydrolase [Vallitalea okinawensis]